MYPLSLWGPVGPGAENDRDDVIRVATSLLSLGHDQAGESADTGEWTASLENEMRAFQRAHGIAIDGVAVPGGETEQSLNDNLATQPSVATRSPPVPRRAIAARESPADSQSVLSERYGKTGRTLPYGNDVHERLFSPGFNAFAIAPANVEHASTRLADPGTGNTARADPVSGLLGNNPITGRPFRLQALGDNAASPYLSAERAPPTDNSGAIARLAKLALQQVQRATPRRSLTLDEQEQILTEYGFRYRPDPMGRIGLGDWLDASGRVLSEDEQAQILRRPDSVRWGMGDKAHKSAATRQLREAIERGQVRRSDFSPEQLDAIRRGEPTIPEHRWHHHQEYGRMQLVPQRIHENTPHIGGVGMRRGQ